MSEINFKEEALKALPGSFWGEQINGKGFALHYERSLVLGKKPPIFDGNSHVWAARSIKNTRIYGFGSTATAALNDLKSTLPKDELKRCFPEKTPSELNHALIDALAHEMVERITGVTKDGDAILTESVTLGPDCVFTASTRHAVRTHPVVVAKMAEFATPQALRDWKSAEWQKSGSGWVFHCGNNYRLDAYIYETRYTIFLYKNNTLELSFAGESWDEVVARFKELGEVLS